MELRAPRVASVAERLVEALRVVDQDASSGGVKQNGCHSNVWNAGGRSPNSSSSGCSSVPWIGNQPMPVPPARGTPAAGGLRQQLPAEADAEHRDLAAQRVLDHPSLDRQPGVDRVLVGIDDAAEDDQAVVGLEGMLRLGASCWRTRPRSRRRRPAERAASASSPESSSCCRARMRIGGILRSLDAGRVGRKHRHVGPPRQPGQQRRRAAPGSRSHRRCGGAAVDEQAAGRDQPVDGDAGAARRERRRSRDGLPRHALAVAGEPEPVVVVPAASRRGRSTSGRAGAARSARRAGCASRRRARRRARASRCRSRACRCACRARSPSSRCGRPARSGAGRAGAGRRRAWPHPWRRTGSRCGRGAGAPARAS